MQNLGQFRILGQVGGLKDSDRKLRNIQFLHVLLWQQQFPFALMQVLLLDNV